MTITKSASNWLEKRSSLGFFAALHAAQNLAVKSGFKNKKVHKLYADRLWQQLLPGKKALPGEATVRGLGGIIPEATTVDGELGRLATRFKNELSSRGVRLAELTPKQLIQVKRIFGGDINKVLKSKDQRSRLIAESLVDSLPEVRKGTARKLLDSPEAVAALSDTLKNNALTGQFLKGITRSVAKASDRPLKKYDNKLVGNVADAGVTGALAAFDPMTAGLNAAKRVVTSHKAGEKFPKLKKFQDFAQKKIVTDPSKNLFERGLKGQDIAFRKPKRFVEELALNPITSNAKNLAYDIGRIVNKYNLT